MSFKLGGMLLEDIVIYPPEMKREWENAGAPRPKAEREITIYEKMVLVAMASFAAKDGTSIHAANRTYAQIAGCSVKTVARAIDKFKADGVLTVDPWKDKRGQELKKRTIRYRLDAPRAVALYCEYLPAAQVPTTDPQSVVTTDPQSVVASDSKDRESRHHDSQVADPRLGVGQSNNPSMNPSAAGGGQRAGSAPPPDAGHQLADAIARWKALQPTIADRLGEVTYQRIGGTWWVVRDFKGRLVIGQPSRMLKDWTDEHLGALAEITARQVEVIVGSQPAPGTAL